MKKFFNNINNKNLFVNLWLLFISTVFCFVFTQNSPWFKFNSFTDSLSYQLIGHQWITNGVIPYKDLFTSAGPLQLFIFAVGSLLKIGGSYIGILLIEIAMLFTSLYYVNKICKLYFKSNKVSILIVTVLQIFMFASVNHRILNQGITRSALMFEKGGTLEEFCLPFVCILIYYLAYVFSKLKENVNFTIKDSVLIGLCFSAIFLIKYQVVVPFILIYIGVALLLFKRQSYLLIKTFIVAIITMIIPIIITFIYFKINGGLSDFISLYFKSSLVDPKNYHYSFIQKLVFGIFNGVNLIKTNYVLITLFAGGLLGLTFTSKINLVAKVSFISLFVLLFASSFSTMNNFSQYLLLLVPICVYGIILIIPSNVNSLVQNSFVTTLVISFVLVLGVCMGNANENIFDSKLTNMNVDNETKLVAQNINSKLGVNNSSTKLVSMFNSDISLYNLTNLRPSTKYFYKPISNSSQYEKYNLNLIKNHLVDYIYVVLESDQNYSNIPFIGLAKTAIETNNHKMKMVLSKKFFALVSKEINDKKLRLKYNKYFNKYYEVDYMNKTKYPLDTKVRFLIKRKAVGVSHEN